MIGRQGKEYYKQRASCLWLIGTSLLRTPDSDIRFNMALTHRKGGGNSDPGL